MTSTPPRIVVHAPGKLFVAGEYAVVTPGEPAMLVAVDPGISVTLAPDAERVVRSSGYAEVRWSPDRDGRIDSAAGAAEDDYVLSTLAVMERLRWERGLAPRPFSLDVESGLDHASGRKYGLGSSGAVSVALVGAIARFYGLADDPVTVYRLAMIATLRVAPNASGGDIAASAFGGWVFYRSPDRDALRRALPSASVTELLAHAGWSTSEVAPLHLPTGLTLLVGWTGEPASTRSLVDAVQDAVRRGAVDHDAFLRASRETVGRLRDAFLADDPDRAQAALRHARSLLHELGEQSGVAIETERLRDLCDIVVRAGGAAKSSGAGGGDCGVALVSGDTDRDHVDRQWQARGIEPLAVSVYPREGARDDR